MTIHCVATYFEKGEPHGYVLGTDSASLLIRLKVHEDGTETEPTVLRRSEVEKAFFGPNYVGLYSGLIDETLINRESGCRSLDNIFEDIEEGTDYSHIPFLQKLRDYRLIIAKRSDDSITLYTVSNANDNPQDDHKAKTLHVLRKDTKINTTLWYYPQSVECEILKGTRPLSKDEAMQAADHCIQMGSESEPGKSHLYTVSFEGIEK